MSRIPPIYDIDFPNYAAEQAAKPFTLPPLDQVNATVPARAGESAENRQNSDYFTGDAVALSELARWRAERAQAEARAGTAAVALTLTPEQVLNLDPEATIRNFALHEFLQTLQPRDNRVAQASYHSWLDLFTRYQMPLQGSNGNATDHENPLYLQPSDLLRNHLAQSEAKVSQDQLLEAKRLAYRRRETAYYDYLGISHPDRVTREMREHMAVNIERWYAGEGVFMPQMLWYSDRNGFRFTPISLRAREATRAQDVLASYSRQQISGYLREMATVTPQEFMYYDPTGLGELNLSARRQFLTRVQTELERAGVQARAEDLRYTFDSERRLSLDFPGLAQERSAQERSTLERSTLERLTQERSAQDRAALARMDSMERDRLERDRLEFERLRADLGSYYGQLLASVQQYSQGIISSSLG